MHLNGEEAALLNDFRGLLSESRRELLSAVDQRIENHQTACDRLIRERTSKPPALLTGGSTASDIEGLGSLVTRSTQFQNFQTSGGKGRVYIPCERRLLTKAMITTDGTTFKPGVQQLPIAGLPQAPLAMTDLIPSRQMSEGSAVFMRQKAPHAIAGVQVNQGDVKAEGVIDAESVTLIPATLAIWIAASQQALQDVLGLQMLIDTELLFALATLEESEILSGDGSEGHLHGIMPQAPTHAATAGDSGIDTIAKAMGALAAAGVRATGVVLNPADWVSLSLTRTAPGGEYLLGPPTQMTPQVLWGVGLALSVAMPAGQYLVGDFQRGTELLYRMAATVEISTEHSDFFVRNLIAVKAEERLGLATKMPSSFRKGALTTVAAAAAAPPAKK